MTEQTETQIVEAYSELITQVSKDIAAKLRETAAFIESKANMYPQGFPPVVVQTFQNCNYLAEQLDPPQQTPAPQPEEPQP